ncbi:MAG: cytochrome c3 family protein, partial [Gemmatimonadaceae bacterium]
MALLFVSAAVLAGCERESRAPATVAPPDEPSPLFRNVTTTTDYAGDAACAGCHAREAAAYARNNMAHSFHRWTQATRTETTLDQLVNAPTGLSYAVIEEGGHLYQVEYLTGPEGTRIHEQRRRMDYVMGSCHVARTYFTEENGRLFQLPLTWYRDHGWDFSPGYEINNARFDRLMPDRCLACHASYPEKLPFLEGKYAQLREGIGCERCHGPGALHVNERKSAVPRDSGYDDGIVNPARLTRERRVDMCEQCHVHTAVSVLREGKDAFGYLPSQPLRDHWAFYRVSGSIDIVSHADRLRQSACFIATAQTSRPLECATCHDPHGPPPDPLARNLPCQECHGSAALSQRLARSASLADHTRTTDCVSCHMPRVRERTVPHGAFTEHWIRVAPRDSTRPRVARSGDLPIAPYFDRDKTGAEAQVYLGMGHVVFATLATEAQAMRQAADALAKALGRDTVRREAHFLLGVASAQVGRTDDAIRALERSVRIDSDRPDALRALAQAYERAGRSPTDIEPLYRRVLALQPALAGIRAEYADWLHSQDRPNEAEAAYRAAVTDQPGLAVEWFNIGTLLAQEGR